MGHGHIFKSYIIALIFNCYIGRVTYVGQGWCDVYCAVFPNFFLLLLACSAFCLSGPSWPLFPGVLSSSFFLCFISLSLSSLSSGRLLYLRRVFLCNFLSGFLTDQSIYVPIEIPASDVSAVLHLRQSILSSYPVSLPAPFPNALPSFRILHFFPLHRYSVVFPFFIPHSLGHLSSVPGTSSLMDEKANSHNILSLQAMSATYGTTLTDSRHNGKTL